ncbi:kinase-like domain-containing protein [Lentinula edodes]|nr:kinase-like domain-containing protein [Lentinula edodes]
MTDPRRNIPISVAIHSVVPVELYAVMCLNGDIPDVQPRTGPDTSNIPSTHIELAEKTKKRLGLGGIPPGTFQNHISTAQIQQQETLIRHSTLSYSYSIYWRPNFLGKPDKFSKNHGNSVLHYSGTEYMEEIQSQLLDILNVQVTAKKSQPPIQLSETSLRFYRSRIPLPGTEHLTLDEFYHQHSNTPQKLNEYIAHLPSTEKPSKNAKERKLYLEFTVDYDCYEERLENTATNTLPVSSRSMTRGKMSTKGPGPASLRKRTLSKVAGALDANFGRPSKILQSNQRFPEGLTSTYKAPESASNKIIIYKPSDIQFNRIDIDIDLYFQPKFISNSSKVITGRLDDKPFAHGGMKAVFGLCIGNQDFVAKRYEKFSSKSGENSSITGSSGSSLDCAEKVTMNKNFIYHDAARLVKCGKFLDDFYQHGRKQGVDALDYNIVFAKCFVLEETDCFPSQASGIEACIGDNDDRMVWLVEQKRSSICHKYTGTLSHSRSVFGGITLETVHAFSHYVYLSTLGQLVVADLQGTKVSTDGKNILVLFDPMTHTLEGTSGCGDFGKDGIQSFVHDHTCGPVCNAMGLDVDYDAADSEPEDNGESGSNEDDEEVVCKPHGKRHFDPIRDEQ